MNSVLVRVLTATAILGLSACSSAGMAPSLPSQGALAGPGSGDVPFLTMNPVHNLCAEPSIGRAECFAQVRTDFMPRAQLAPDAGDARCPFYGQGYCPVDLQSAYDLPSGTAGKDKVVAIVDAYGYHHAAGDLAQYRKTMGLPACSTATKCLRIVNQEGDPSPLPGEPPPSDDWRGEESLDLDMVSAICPNCKIVLVQTNNNDTSNLYAGVKTAGSKLGAKYVSASWGSPESGPDNGDFHQAGVVITAAAGDNGGGGRYHGGPYQPCSYTYVVCVGGTHLVRANNSRGWSENVWNDWTFDFCGSGSSPCGATGSGCSKKISKPPWQTDTQCGMRSEADISADASLRTPVIVYNSEIAQCSGNCWYLFGGTSASTPMIASVYALAGNAATQGGASGLWKHHAGNVYDVTLGNNLDANLGVTCASTVHYICYARVGFDGPTGWGSPKGIGAF